MKYLVINASPRGHRSRTMKITKRFMKGILKHDPTAELDIVHLAAHAMHNCEACFTCWSSSTKGRCKLNDKDGDLFEKYAEKYLNSDRLIISSPVHFYNCSSLLMRFIERTISLTMPINNFEKELAEKGKDSFKDSSYGYMWTKDVTVISTAWRHAETYELFDLFFSKMTWNEHQKIYMPNNVKRTKEFNDLLKDSLDKVELLGVDFAKNGTFSEENKWNFNNTKEKLLHLLNDV